MTDSDDIQLEKRGGPNDFWHIAERHEGDEDSSIHYEVVNYARHERIYIHDATKARAEKLCELLCKVGF